MNSNDYAEIGAKTQADAFLYFLQRLDINRVSNVLEDARNYQNFEKPLFIEKLSNVFQEFIQAGDTYLNGYDGVCNSKTCNFNCKGFSFVGNISENYFDMIIDIKDGFILDIYECFSLKCKNQDVNKKDYIVLDQSEYPF